MAIKVGVLLSYLDRTPPNFCVLLSYLYVSILQLIISPLFIFVFDGLPSIKNFLVDLHSFFFYSIFQYQVILVKIFSSLHLGNFLEILNDRPSQAKVQSWNNSQNHFALSIYVSDFFYLGCDLNRLLFQ